MDEAPSRRRDRLEDALALLHSAKEIIAEEARAEDRRARDRMWRARQRTAAPIRNPKDAA